MLYVGYGSLGLSVEGPHRSDLEMKSKSASEYTLQYKPHEPGVYLLNIKFADDHIAGTRRRTCASHNQPVLEKTWFRKKWFCFKYIFLFFLGF